MTNITADQVALQQMQAAEQERVNIRELEQLLKQAKTAQEKSVLKYRIKICKSFLRDYMRRAQACQYVSKR